LESVMTNRWKPSAASFRFCAVAAGWSAFTSTLMPGHVGAAATENDPAQSAATVNKLNRDSFI